MKPYAGYAATYGFLPKVPGIDRGQAEIGLLMNTKSVRALRILDTTIGISGAMDSDAYLGILSMTGVSDKQLQEAEIEIIKRKATSGSDMRNI
jgi:hypothetical protein